MKELKSEFFKYVSLNVIGMIGLSCYILADTFFVSKALGTVGLAALNFTLPIYSILHGLGLMIGIGGATDFSVHMQGNHENPRSSAFMHSVVAGGVTGLVFLIIAIFFAVPLSIILGADSQTLPLTSLYMKTILSFSPFFILNNILLAFVRNDKNSKLSMTAMLVSSFSNIVLDYIFMFPFSMGMFGAALATGLSPIISMCVLSFHFISKKNNFHFEKCVIRIREIINIIALGFSAFIGEFASAVSVIVFNLIIFRLEGNIGVAAYGVVANTALVATAIFVGTSQGLQPIASRSFGKGDTNSVNLILGYSVKTGLVLAVVVYATVFVLSDVIVSAFNGGGSEQFAILAVKGMKIYFGGYIFAGINIIASAFLSATCNYKHAILLSLLRSCVVLVPAVFILSGLFNITGTWFSFVFTEFVVFTIAVMLLKSRKKEA